MQLCADLTHQSWPLHPSWCDGSTQVENSWQASFSGGSATLIKRHDRSASHAAWHAVSEMPVPMSLSMLLLGVQEVQCSGADQCDGCALTACEHTSAVIHSIITAQCAFTADQKCEQTN
jgi:hypothetical protein